MNYAVWIALLVVFIAVVPPIVKNARAGRKSDSPVGDGSATSGGDSSCDAGSDGSGDCGGGD